MPFKLYHGRTGRIFNINPRSIGVKILKKVGHRFIEKMLHIRVEHIKKSSCRDGFLKRIKENDKKKAEFNKKNPGKHLSTKRLPPLPKEAYSFKPKTLEF
mmetsp:Transcript_31195/g.43620  ORF Transcript_31195/g.43620 Transcript_31195/m.43620 type:complete len:100 (-) Transcript_31195:115-414(-)